MLHCGKIRTVLSVESHILYVGLIILIIPHLSRGRNFILKIYNYRIEDLKKISSSDNRSIDLISESYI